MRRRARDLTVRARERIRAAREHDPHGWHHHDDGEPAPIDFVQDPQEDDVEPPLGSPEAGAPLHSSDGARAPRTTSRSGCGRRRRGRGG